ncbi:MAG: ATP-binding protein [Saprospiraceae bacterium]
METAFYNRATEKERIADLHQGPGAKFGVVYGRRRCGKSTLLQRTMRPVDIYYLAAPGEAVFQRRILAETLSEIFPGFDLPEYSSWQILLLSLNQRANERFTLILDEFPYLIKSDASLPGILQGLLEDRSALNYNLILCGSSQ